jgi:hypothetical protein
MQGHDTGIDLYCEKVKDGIPYLHFWCQIKSSNKWKGIKNSIKFNGKKNHINYWLKQPAPVFIFLVPDIRDLSEPPYYICRAIDFYLNRSPSIQSSWKINSVMELKQFLELGLIFESYLWDLKDGKVSHLKTPKGEYTLLFPKGASINFEPKIKQSIIWTLNHLSYDLLFYRENPSKLLSNTPVSKKIIDKKKKAEPYIKALEALILAINDEHYENYELIGLYYELENNFFKANKYYTMALKSLNNDPVINKNQPPWKEVIQDIHGHIKRIKQKLN